MSFKERNLEKKHMVFPLSDKLVNVYYNLQVHCPSEKRQELKKTERENLKEQMMAKYVEIKNDLYSYWKLR